MIQFKTSENTKEGKVLIVEDHSYFATELIAYLREDRLFDVVYASNFSDAVSALDGNSSFDFSILDILLQNGKTGVDIVEKFKNKLGRILFVTGCVDEAVLNKIEDYASASKLHEIWPPLEKFLAGGCPKINSDDDTAARLAKLTEEETYPRKRSRKRPSKLRKIWPPLEKFLADGCPKTNLDDDIAARLAKLTEEEIPPRKRPRKRRSPKV
jgi:CheY-like chemotaxis protein